MPGLEAIYAKDNLTAGKADLFLNNQTYHFSKAFSSFTGLGTQLGWEIRKLPPGMASGTSGMAWYLFDNTNQQPEEIAKFTVTANIYKKMMEGELTVLKQGGMSPQQFDEVFATLVAEVERDRKKQGKYSCMGETLIWLNCLTCLG